MDKVEIAYRVVGFWHVIEFLSQDSFPEDTKENRKRIELIKKISLGEKVSQEDYKKALQGKKIKKFHNVPINKEIYEMLIEDDKLFAKYPEVGSKIHLCIGKIKRDFLIKKLYECLNLEDKRPEQDCSDICLIGLKVDKDGIYIENSFCISPMIWGIYKCIESKGKVDGIISSENYKDELKIFEEKISKTEPFKTDNIKELYEAVFDKYI